MAKRVTIVTDEITSRVYADNGKKVHRLGAKHQEEHDPDSTLFVGAVTTEVQIKNEECYVMLPVKGHITRLKIDTGSQGNIMPFKDLKKIAIQR